MAPVSILQGPIGSGKTLASAMKIRQVAGLQRVQKDGKIRCRAHVIRDTYSRLDETTVQTWLQWFPEKQFGKFYWSKPHLHEIRIKNLELDVVFVALEDDKEASFFRSLETTIIWFNELGFTDRGLFDEALTRVGRFPGVIDGGAVNPMVIGDLNAPDEMHWLPIMRGDVPMPDHFTDSQRRAHTKPEDWKFFTQPAGLIETYADGEIKYAENPAAENVKYLQKGYYLKAVQAKTKAWIDANVMNKVSPRRDGKPVFPDFTRDMHVSKTSLSPVPNYPLICGLDFGRQPAALIGQYVRGRWYILAELIGYDMGATRFAPVLKNFLAQKFSGFEIALWGDPSGDFRGQADEQTPFRVFRANGLSVMAAPGANLLTVRLQAVESALTTLVEGKPKMIVDPGCTNFIAAMDGGYHFRRINVSGERYSEEPEKDQYSHIADAGQYLMLGGGEGKLLLTGTKATARVVDTRRQYNPFKQRQQCKPFQKTLRDLRR